MTSSTLIIGTGNEWRGDDAAGLLAARALAQRHLPGVTILEQDSDGANLMDAWADAAAVILLDAVQAGGAPGTIYRVDARQERIPPELFGASSHLLGVGAAIELARALGQLPPRFIIYGVEGVHYELGAPLSPAVAASLPLLVNRVIQEISNGTNDRQSP